MDLKKLIKMILLFLFVYANTLFADGLLLSQNEDYPGLLLRNKTTKVNVKIHGLIAEVVVYQEFVNEWNETVDAVFNFPLPDEARSTELFYWRNDTTFKAILKVKSQIPNPGTGEGGLAALVNQYIGNHGIKLQLSGITPGMVQKVELHYFTLLNYFQGECRFKYPLDTKNFIKYPIDHLELNIDVESRYPIVGFGIPSHPEYTILENSPSHLKLRMRQLKAYLAKNLIFQYKIENNDLDVDFYSSISDSLNGHFALFLLPPTQGVSDQTLSKNIVFLLSKSNTMIGYKLDQSIEAIKNSLDLLNSEDSFNILLFDSYAENWRSHLVQATPQNIEEAKTYLDGISGGGGNRLDYGLELALDQFQDSNRPNVILAFTDGRSPLDPKYIVKQNHYRTSIDFVAIGNDIDRDRLEMTAALNYGFVSYFDENDNLRKGIIRVFKLINQPVLRNVEYSFDKGDIYNQIPERFPTTFAGSIFYTVGKYREPGLIDFKLWGISDSGDTQFTFPLEFTSQNEIRPYVKYLWAKEMIDAIEREINVYGETEALKDSVIAISLRYGMRCKYTSYYATYQLGETGIAPAARRNRNLPASFILTNYPNPFNPTTTIRIYIDNSATGKVKLLKIYNLLGQLVAVIDISHLMSGWHKIRFNAVDMYGNILPSGLYFVRLQIGNEFVNTIRITLLR